MIVRQKAGAKSNGPDLKFVLVFTSVFQIIILYVYLFGSEEVFSWPKDLNLEEMRKIISGMTQTESKLISICFFYWNSDRTF